jgi:hypothetical protein
VTLAKIKAEAEAEATYVLLAGAYEQAGSYWRAGHSFDTVLDYFEVVSSEDAADFGAVAKAKFGALTGPTQWDAYWYDDHGWWGVAALRASQHPEWFGGLSADFAEISQRCWTTMNTYAPAVWDDRPGKGGSDPFASLQPRISGGVWNSGWSKVPKPGNSPCDPTSKAGQALCGYQNSVTNLLYLLLASRRFAEFKDKHDHDAADGEYKFLMQWAGVEPATDALLDRWTATNAPADAGQDARLVIRAEVSTYAKGRVCEYSSEFNWAGDQGLFLGALVERMAQTGKSDPGYSELLGTATALLAGTYDRLTSNRILRYWVQESAAAGGDCADYKTGIAVFFRYLLHAYRTNADLKALLSDKRSVYPAFVLANAEAAMRPDQDSCTDTNSPADNDLLVLTNKLARLVAAFGMLT